MSPLSPSDASMDAHLNMRDDQSMPSGGAQASPQTQPPSAQPELPPDTANRFNGITRLIGRSSLECLQQSHVAVIGVGGVGSWAVEALARSGIGRLTLIDLDDVCVTNINRQLPALDGQIGRPKVEVLAERMHLINPRLEINAIAAFVTPHNVDQYISDKFDHVIDAIDSISAKTALVTACVKMGIDITVTGGAGGLVDPTRIRRCDLAHTTHDALLAKLRRNLRQEHGFPRNPKRKFKVTCITSDEARRYPSSDGTVSVNKPARGEPTRMDCTSGFGAATFTTGSFGFAAAAHAVERLTRFAEA